MRILHLKNWNQDNLQAFKLLKMRYFCFILLLIMVNHCAIAQDWIISSAQKGDLIEPRYSSIDSQNNTVFLSVFQNSIYQTGFNSYSGSIDIALTKISPQGNLLWSKQIGSNSTETGGGIAIDENSNIYIAGNYSSLCNFTPVDFLINKGGTDIFLAKYSPSGSLIWAKAIASTANNQAATCLKYNNGRLILGGYFNGTMILGTDITKTDTLLGNTNTTSFVTLLDTIGNPIWSKRFLGNDDATRFTDIGVGQHALYLCGYYKQNLHLDIETLTCVNSTITNSFLFKIDFNGNGVWVRKLTGTGSNYYRAICLDNQDDPYLIGNSNGSSTLILDSIANITTRFDVAYSQYNIFLAKYSSEGVLNWFKNKGTGYNSYFYGIECKNNLLYTTGYFSRTIIWANDVLNSTSSSDGEPFLAMLTLNGDEIKGVKANGTGNYYDSFYTIDVDNNSQVHIGGFFRSQTFHIGDSTYTSSNVNKSDQFFAVYKHPLIGLVTESEDPSCYGRSDGEIEVEAYFGKLPYTYSWSHNPALNQAQAYNLAAGDYTVTITDALGEQTTVSKTLTEPQSVGFSAIITSVQCYGDSTGAADVTVLNASGTPEYDWSTGATTEDVTDLKAGTYSLTITDSLGCTAFGVITVDEPDSMSLALSRDQDILCAGDSTAIVTATASGGMDLFSYQWNDPLYQTEATATDLPAGTWRVTVTDANGCTRTDSVVLSQPVAITLSLTATDPTCAGLDNGSALATAGGGTGTLSYAWSNGTAAASNADLTAGTYSVTVTDGNLCTQTDSVTLNEPAALAIATVNATAATCFGYEDGTLAISASGGTGTLHYSIDGTQQFIVPLFDSVAAGVYTITVTDSLDCTADTTAEITQPDGMALTVSQLETIACHGAATASATVSVTGATGTVSYLWDDPEAQTADTALNLGAGDYSVQATDASGCKVTGGITVIEPEILTIDTTEVVQIDETHPAGSVTLEASGGTGPFTFFITPDSTSASTGVFTELAAGDYAFFATDVNGCTSEDLAVTITEGEGPVDGLQFYDAFSPNGDGKNDVWNIRNIDQYPNCVVKIFNAWGTPVFSSKGYGTPWDGKSGGNELPSGTYYYLVDPGDGSPSRTGPVSLVK